MVLIEVFIPGHCEPYQLICVSDISLMYFMYFRNMLTAVEASGAHAIRLTLCRQLAELLLRGIAGLAYNSPTGEVFRTQNTESTYSFVSSEEC